MNIIYNQFYSFDNGTMCYYSAEKKMVMLESGSSRVYIPLNEAEEFIKAMKDFCEVEMP